MKRSLSLLVLLCMPLIATANIGDTAEELVQRYGKPDNNQALLNGKKMFWKSIQGCKITVMLRKRGDQTVSVHEKVMLSTERLLTTELAGQLLRDRVPNGKWKMIQNEKHGRRGTVLRSRVAQFQHAGGQFAVYVWREVKSPLKPEPNKEAFLVFLDAIAFEEFRQQGADVL